MKKIFIIIFLFQTFGWVAYIVVCAFGLSLPYSYRFGIVMFGVVFNLIAILVFLFSLNNRGLWLRNKILEDEIKQTQKARRELKATEEMFSKFNRDLIAQQTKKE